MRPGAQRLAFEVRVYRAPVHEYIVGRRSAVGQVSRLKNCLYNISDFYC